MKVCDGVTVGICVTAEPQGVRACPKKAQLNSADTLSRLRVQQTAHSLTEKMLNTLIDVTLLQ